MITNVADLIVVHSFFSLSFVHQRPATHDRSNTEYKCKAVLSRQFDGNLNPLAQYVPLTCKLTYEAVPIKRTSLRIKIGDLSC